MRRIVRTVVTTAATASAVLAGTDLAEAAAGSTLKAPAKSGTVSASYTASISGTGRLDPVLPCSTTYCDERPLTISAPATYWKTHTGSLTVSATWSGAYNDFDLYLYDKSGKEVASSGEALTTTEKMTISLPKPGTYTISLVSYLAQPSTPVKIKATLAVKAK